MGAFGPVHWLIVAVVALLLFGGRGKITGIMGDTAKGIKAFREGLKDDADTADKSAAAAAPAAPLPRTDKDEARG